jgi:CIC family chloride channel protein
MKTCGHTEAYVIAESGHLLGKVTIYMAIEAGSNAISEFMDSRPMTLYTDESLEAAMIKVSQFVGESLPVVNKETGALHGSIAEGALFQAVIDVQYQARNLERT